MATTVAEAEAAYGWVDAIAEVILAVAPGSHFCTRASRLREECLESAAGRAAWCKVRHNWCRSHKCRSMLGAEYPSGKTPTTLGGTLPSSKLYVKSLQHKIPGMRPSW